MDVEIRKTIELNEKIKASEYGDVKVIIFRVPINQEYDAFAAAAMWKFDHIGEVITGVIPWYDDYEFELKLVIE